MFELFGSLVTMSVTNVVFNPSGSLQHMCVWKTVSYALSHTSRVACCIFAIKLAALLRCFSFFLSRENQRGCNTEIEKVV